MLPPTAIGQLGITLDAQAYAEHWLRLRWKSSRMAAADASGPPLRSCESFLGRDRGAREIVHAAEGWAT